jgi:hypothetical protein
VPGKGKRKARRLNPAGQICPIGLSAEPKPRALVVTVSAVLRGRDLKTGIEQPLDNDLGRRAGCAARNAKSPAMARSIRSAFTSA